jgi:ABC-type antimicrobial peptide transport system permease subunit
MGTVATRRSRRQDLTSLRLVGARRADLRRSAITEQLAIVITSVLVGTTMGVLGAHLAMPSIPIFVDQQPVPPIRLPIAWPSVLIAAGSLLVLLGTTAVIAALRPVRAAGGQPFREVHE